MELVKTNVTFKVPTIDYDVKDIDNQISLLEERYQGLVIAEEQIADIKKEISQFNKIKKAISTKRIETVKKIKKPLTTFENDLKAFEKRLGDLYTNIGNQIKTFENEQKQARRAKIEQWEEFKPFMTFEDRWLNKSTSDKVIKFEISAQQTMYNNNVQLIETTCRLSGLEKEKYINKLNEKVDINSIIVLIENDKQVKESYVAPKEGIKEPTVKIANETKHTERYYITATNTQLNVLESYMLENGIEYQIDMGMTYYEEDLF